MARKQRTPTRRKSEDRDRRPRRKISILAQERVDWIDYKDVNLLRRFMSERAKIRARRVTGNDAQQQRAVARAIRIAREMALLPYAVRQVTHRNKGGKGGRDRGDRGELAPLPMGPPPTPSAGDEPPRPDEASTPEVPTAEVPTAEAPTAAAPTAEVPTADVAPDDGADVEPVAVAADGGEDAS